MSENYVFDLTDGLERDPVVLKMSQHDYVVIQELIEFVGERNTHLIQKKLDRLFDAICKSSKDEFISKDLFDTFYYFSKTLLGLYQAQPALNNILMPLSMAEI